MLAVLAQLCAAVPVRAQPAQPDLWPNTTSPIPRDPAIEARITQILAGMSLEEKVGQIIQADISAITPDEAAQYHIGSVLNGGNSGPGGDLRAPPEAWLDLADEFWVASTADGSLPLLWGTDAVHGHANIVGATLFPHNIGLGAARDPHLIERIAAITATEIAVTGLDWNFAPVLATPRNLRWGRTYEGYSENPEVIISFAPAMVYGLQGRPNAPDFLGPNKVLATAKHFLGDGGTIDGVDQGETDASEEELRDIHGAGYGPAIEAGVQTVMASYSSWRGRKMHGRKDLLTDVLVGQMGFDGFVVGDWNGHGQIQGCTETDCPQALLAGIDMYMAPDSWRGLFETTLKQVRDGRIAVERLNEAVARVLRVKLRYRHDERGRPSSRPLAGRFELLGAPEHRAVAREAVRESLVLLKNDGVLPLAPNARILVAGDGA
ncbi:MAG: glycoside hydrolase family 3 protein, partial [Pseudomonadota bacterium]